MDATKAKALELAKQRLDHLGWKYNCNEIGEKAADIIIAMEKKLAEARIKNDCTHD